MPKKFEVWFISIDRTSEVQKFLPNSFIESYAIELDQVAASCQPVGDMCFDPQLGIYDPKDKKNPGTIKDTKDPKKTVSNLDESKVARSVGREMIHCDRGTYFDVFCGKATKSKSKNHKLEVWIDISSSMKQTDAEDMKGECKRLHFLNRLDKQCPLFEKVGLYGFDTQLKELGDRRTACLNYGLNNMERIQKRIEKSNAKHLVVITDIFEAHEDFLNFIESSPQGSHQGVDSPMYASSLTSKVSKISKSCKK